MALELKGSYFVANIMTNTYVEVSKRYIIPGVAHTDRLTLPDTTPMSREACVQKIEEVGQLAKEARMNISHLANTVSFSSLFPICIRSLSPCLSKPTVIHVST